MIYAVDFDGTICVDCYPNIGAPKESFIAYLKNLKAEDHKLILWTCRNGERLNEAVIWCLSHGLVFDAINENLPETIEKYGSDSRKITADFYIDDRNSSIMPLLEEVY